MGSGVFGVRPPLQCAQATRTPRPLERWTRARLARPAARAPPAPRRARAAVATRARDPAPRCPARVRAERPRTRTAHASVVGRLEQLLTVSPRMPRPHSGCPAGTFSASGTFCSGKAPPSAPTHPSFPSGDLHDTATARACGTVLSAVCAANSFSLATASSCTACPTGSTSTVGSATCSCNAGRYGTGSGLAFACPGMRSTRSLRIRLPVRAYGPAGLSLFAWSPRIFDFQSAPRTRLRTRPERWRLARRAQLEALARRGPHPAPAPPASRPLARDRRWSAQVRIGALAHAAEGDACLREADARFLIGRIRGVCSLHTRHIQVDGNRVPWYVHPLRLQNATNPGS